MNIKIVRFISNYLELLKYGVVGVLGAGIHFFTMVLCVEVFGISSLISSVIGFSLSLVISFILNYKWTFSNRVDPQDGNHNRTTYFIKYVVVSLSGLLVNLITIYLMNDVFLIWYVYAQLTASFIVPIHNYFLNKFWTFNKKFKRSTT
ncbi:hypothetical protein BK126_21465 [Paenibacillus sp. FSL H7-0326]|uniref:GtrA family protein n=1 Tax=Paenibacillus sp. FSL H7-0326 TaxID=1921144 RepID=UPI00096C359E|nr:hypothetical protein BK126_21465 [Paenibacillus sp. FSL H7-0326]